MTQKTQSETDSKYEKSIHRDLLRAHREWSYFCFSGLVYAHVVRTKAQFIQAMKRRQYSHARLLSIPTVKHISTGFFRKLSISVLASGEMLSQGLFRARSARRKVLKARFFLLSIPILSILSTGFSAGAKHLSTGPRNRDA